MKKILLVLLSILLLTGCASNIEKENKITRNITDNSIDQSLYGESFSENGYMKYIALPMYTETLIELYGNNYVLDDSNKTYCWVLSDCKIIAHYSEETNMITSISFDKEIELSESINLDTSKEYTYEELKKMFKTEGYICFVEYTGTSQILGICWQTNTQKYIAYFDTATNKTTTIITVEK